MTNPENFAPRNYVRDTPEWQPTLDVAQFKYVLVSDKILHNKFVELNKPFSGTIKVYKYTQVPKPGGKYQWVWVQVSDPGEQHFSKMLDLKVQMGDKLISVPKSWNIVIPRVTDSIYINLM